MHLEQASRSPVFLGLKVRSGKLYCLNPASFLSSCFPRLQDMARLVYSPCDKTADGVLARAPNQPSSLVDGCMPERGKLQTLVGDLCLPFFSC